MCSSDLILGADGAVRAELKLTSYPLGIRPDTAYADSAEYPLAEGELVLLFTDGVEETISETEEFFGTERALEIARRNRSRTAAEIVEAIYQAAQQFSGALAQEDDITIIVIKAMAKPSTSPAS